MSTATKDVAPNQLRRISLASAVSIVIASMIGAGVYTTSGFALADLGHPYAVILAWTVGGLLAICGAISYGALASRFVESGGEFLFLSRAIHPAAGCVAGFVSMIAGFTGAIALAAITFETYLPSTVRQLNLPSGLAGSMLVVAAAMVHGFRLRLGTRVQDTIVWFKFVMLIGFIVVSLWVMRDSLLGFTPWPGIATTPNDFALAVPTFAISLVWISLSYSGFNAAIYVSGEIRDAQRNVPRALWIGTLAVTAIYIALNGLFVLITPYDRIAGQGDVAVIAAEAVGGPWLASALRAVILLSLATSVSALIMTGPRVYAKMAEEGVLPIWMGWRSDAPHYAIAFQALLALVLIQVTSLLELLSYLGMTLSFTAALTIAAIFWLRYRGDKVHVPFYPWPPLIYVASVLTLTGVAAWMQPSQAKASAATFAVGLVVFRLANVGR